MSEATPLGEAADNEWRPKRVIDPLGVAGKEIELEESDPKTERLPAAFTGTVGGDILDKTKPRYTQG